MDWNLQNEVTVSKMKKLLVCPALVLAAALLAFGQPSTPTFISHSSGSMVVGACCSIPAGGYYNTHLVQPRLASNLLLSACTFDNTTAPAIAFTDDGSDTWTTVRNALDSPHGQKLALAAAYGAGAGAHVLHAQFSTGPTGAVTCVGTEFAGIATSSAADGDNSNANGSNSTTVTAGSITPTAAGDLWFNCAIFYADPGTVTPGSGSDTHITWALVNGGAGRLNSDNLACQWGVEDGTTNAINPTMRISNSIRWFSIAGAFKKATAGTAQPAGILVQAIEHLNVDQAVGTTDTIQFPTTGNLLLAEWVGGLRHLDSITDSTGQTWTATRTECTGTTSSVRLFYAANASASNTRTLTLNYSSTGHDGTLFLVDVAGANSSPFDLDSGCLSGNQTSDGALTLDIGSLTPTTSNGLVVAMTGWDFDTVAGTTGSGQITDTYTSDGCPLSGPCPLDENNGWMHYKNPSTSAVNVTWNFTDDPAYNGAGNWEGLIAAFKAPAATTVPDMGGAWIF